MRRAVLSVLFLFTVGAEAGVPCHTLVREAGEMASLAASLPNTAPVFATAVAAATKVLSASIESPEAVMGFQPFPREQVVDIIDVTALSTDGEAARVKALQALLLVAEAAPPPVSQGFGILGKMKLGKKSVPAKPLLPENYSATPILVQDAANIRRYLADMTSKLKLTSGDSKKWWWGTAIWTAVWWPMAAYSIGDAALNRWLYTNIDFTEFANAVNAALNASEPPALAPLNLMIGVRNVAVSYQLVFHWANGGTPVLLGSYAEAPRPN